MAHKHILLKLNDGINDKTPAVVKEVEILQTVLKDWGELDIDGKFGNKTDEAVKDFQGKKSLEVDGIVGKKTWAALLNVNPSEVEIISRQSQNESKVKSIILAFWLMFLSILSALALGGNTSRLFQIISETVEQNIPIQNSRTIPKMCKPDSSVEKQDLSGCTYDQSFSESPSLYLREYFSEKYSGKFYEEVPPIASVLDLLQVNISWRDLEKINEFKEEPKKIKQKEDNKPDDKPNDYKKQDFDILFEIIEAKLIALTTSNSENVNSLTISNEILPAKFRFSPSDKFEKKEIPLPPEAKNWVIQEIATKNRLKFIDTCMLLIILGAFGSIIFLISQHMKNEDKIEIKSYIFRPIFGILLAIATFVISISINGLTSTGKIEDLRTETILFLAFAAGLLSDKTYEMITKRTGNQLDNSNGQKTETENTEQTVSKLNSSNAQNTETESDKTGIKNNKSTSSHSSNNGAVTD